MEILCRNLYSSCGDITDITPSKAEDFLNSAKVDHPGLFRLAYNFFKDLFPYSSEIQRISSNDIDELFDISEQSTNPEIINRCHSDIHNLVDKDASLLERYTHENWETPKPKNIANITVTITSCKRLALFKRTMNSFLNCCTDLHRVKEWLCVDDNSGPEEREEMSRMYPFIKFYLKTEEEKGHPSSMNIIRERVNTPYIFHMEDDWVFYRHDNYLTKCLEVLTHETYAKQCLINRSYAELAINWNIVGNDHRILPSGRSYYQHMFYPADRMSDFYKRFGGGANCAYWPHYSFRPGLIRTEILKELGEYDNTVNHFEMDYAHKFQQHGYESAFLPGIFCYHIGRLTSERNDENKMNAYALNNEGQFSGRDKPVPVEVTPKTYVINLDRRVDRLATMNGYISNFERYRAVDGAELTPNRSLSRLFDGNDYRMRQGMVGCALSHLHLIVQLLSDEENEYYLLLEDDLEIVPEFDKKIDHVLAQLNDTENWGMCYIGHHAKMTTPETYSLTEYPRIEKWGVKETFERSLGGTGGYLISKHGAKIFLSFIKKFGMTNGIDTVQQKAANVMDIYYTTTHLYKSDCANFVAEADTDIQRNHISLDQPILERVLDEIAFYNNELEQVLPENELKTGEFKVINSVLPNEGYVIGDEYTVIIHTDNKHLSDRMLYLYQK